ncbi:MAG: epoxide hydrolase family protein [Microbacterium sp.]
MLKPFTIDVSDEELATLRRRLVEARFAEDFQNEDWGYGMNGAYLKELVDYWINEYDWRAHEAEINSYQNVRGEIDGVIVHALIAEGKGKRRIPLILSHGWPWTFWDFKDVIVPLTDPASVGLDDAVAFDVVIPSLPGFGYSSPLRQTGLSPQRISDLFHKLMTEELGYERYAVHGGDLGSFVSANLGHGHAESVIGVHLSLPAMLGVDFAANTAGSKAVVGPEDFADDEQGWFEHNLDRAAKTRAHSIAHRESPQSLGFAFNDSPIGLASWIVERRRLWSDCNGDVESVFSKDFLITLLSIYWFTQTVTTSMRAYADMGLGDWERRHDRIPTLDVPTAIAVMPEDNLLLPRAFVEKHVNLRRWTRMPRGGHFAAAEQPELIANDIRAFFSELE